jgi:hypothetical protein
MISVKVFNPKEQTLMKKKLSEVKACRKKPVSIKSEKIYI